LILNFVLSGDTFIKEHLYQVIDKEGSKFFAGLQLCIVKWLTSFNLRHKLLYVIVFWMILLNRYYLCKICWLFCR